MNTPTPGAASELRSCPFCGASGHASEDDGTGVAYCSNLDCPAHEMLGCSMEQWNTRTPSPAMEGAQREAVAQILNALRLYETAWNDLFDKCLSNGVFNRWNEPVNCTNLNHAHQLAQKALAAYLSAPPPPDRVQPERGKDES